MKNVIKYIVNHQPSNPGVSGFFVKLMYYACICVVVGAVAYFLASVVLHYL